MSELVGMYAILTLDPDERNYLHLLNNLTKVIDGLFIKNYFN